MLKKLKKKKQYKIFLNKLVYMKIQNIYLREIFIIFIIFFINYKIYNNYYYLYKY